MVGVFEIVHHYLRNESRIILNKVDEVLWDVFLVFKRYQHLDVRILLLLAILIDFNNCFNLCILNVILTYFLQLAFPLFENELMLVILCKHFDLKATSEIALDVVGGITALLFSFDQYAHS